MPKNRAATSKARLREHSRRSGIWGRIAEKLHATFPEAGRPMMTGLWAAQALAV